MQHTQYPGQYSYQPGQTPQQAKISWKPLRAPLIASFVLALMLLIGVVIVQQNTQSVSIGVTGYAANITLSGWGATAAANKEVASDQGKTYIMETPATGMELCNGTIKGIHYIVRDTGNYTAIGNQVCSYMQKAAALNTVTTSSDINWP